jgi:hypothetical protein
MKISKYFYILYVLILFSCAKKAELLNNKESTQVINQPIESPFFYKTLKDWTNAAFDWDEAKKGAQSSEDFGNIPIPEGKYIAKEELELALKLFAEKAAESAADKSMWLDTNAPSDAYFDVENQSYSNDYFAQKVHVSPDHEIVVMGDFHGSLHSLLRNLWRLQKLAYLANDFSLLRPNTSFVFTGDFIDRGRYGAEILYTLFRLKLANWDRVYLIRGNHEEQDSAENYGFEKEIYIKYTPALGILGARNFFWQISDVFRFLPVVFFVHLEKNNNINNIHFSHGGYGFNFSNKTFVHNPKVFLEAAETIKFERIPENKHYGYQWTDFQQNLESAVSIRGFAKRPDDGVFTSGLADLESYLSNNNLRAIFRGHQDREFGVKLLFKDANNIKISAAKDNNFMYRDGPYHWSDVLEEQSLLASVRKKGLPLTLFAPVFTFTTASEGQALPFDAFAILQCKEKWEDFRLLVHEIALPRSRPSLAYVDISPKVDPDDDEIHVQFKYKGPGRCLIDP